MICFRIPEHVAGQIQAHDTSPAKVFCELPAAFSGGATKIQNLANFELHWRHALKESRRGLPVNKIRVIK